ncbi:MAG: ribonuclease H-like domain-containing protein [Methanomassiliicoccales archaeon]
MIQRSFILLPGVGKILEKKLWLQGISSWDDFLLQKKISGFSDSRKRYYDNILLEAKTHFIKSETNYFYRLLPSSEHWRLFECIEKNVIYLDIETDGNFPNSNIILIGMFRNNDYIPLIRDINLTSFNLKNALLDCKMLVTFNGSTFDLPCLEREFSFSIPKVPHFDLRFGCSRLGLKGGLKQIESRFKISRPKELEYVTGENIAYLWRLWKKSSKQNALNTLLKYNEFDVKNLKPIANKIYEGLRSQCLKFIEY